MQQAESYIMEQDHRSILFAHKAALLLSEDKADQALELCEKGVRLFPAYAEGHHMLGRCYQALQYYAKAEEEFHKALSFMPHHLQAQKGLAYLAFKKQDRDKGNALLLNHALYDPLNPELMHYLKEEGLLSRLYPWLEEKQETAAQEMPEPEQPPVSDEVEEQPPPQPTPPQQEEMPQAPQPRQDISSLIEEEFGEELASIAEDLPDLDQIPEDKLEKKYFPEQDEKMELEPVLDEDELIDMPIQSVEEDRTELERESLIADLAEESAEQKSMPELDLNQFKNTEDDFSSVMQDILTQPSEEEPEELEEVASEPVIEQAEEEEMVTEVEEEPAAEDEEEEIVEEETPLQQTPAHEETKAMLERLDEKKKQPPSPSLLDDENVDIEEILENPSLLTPTFGEILIAQKKFEDAKRVFEKLLEREPENQRFKKKIDFLNKIIAYHK